MELRPFLFKTPFAYQRKSLLRRWISQTSIRFSSAAFPDLLAAVDLACSRFSQMPNSLNSSVPFSALNCALRVNATREPHFPGRFSGTANMGGITVSSIAGAVSNLYITACNAYGNTKWAVAVPSNSGQSGGHRVAFDVTSNVYVAGWYSGTGLLNNILLTVKSGNNAADLAMAKFNPAGNLQWFNNYGAAGFTSELNIAAGLAVDKENNLLITGKFYGSNVD